MAEAPVGQMKELQVELKGAKEKWLKEIELSKAEKGAPNYPFPVAITRYTPQPESAAMWDCEELPVRFVVHDAEIEKAHVSVEVPPIFPGELSVLMQKRIQEEWIKLLKKKKKPAGEVWMIDSAFTFVETEFGKLLRLNPEYVDTYEGCDAMGATQRRYTLVGPAAEEDEDEEEDEVDEEEQEKRVQEYIAREQARLEADIEAKYANDEERKTQALSGINVDGEKAKQLSKKEKAEMNLSRKEKSGHRWRKTGSKSHKPVKEEGAAAGGKKK